VIAFRPLCRGDFALLSVWLEREHVARWWPDPHDPASLEAHYGPSIDALDPTEVFVTLVEDRPVGMIQRYLVADYPEWERAVRSAGVTEPAVGIDYLIGEPDLIGRGLGPRVISAFVAETWARYPEVPQLVVAVQQENRHSWRALEKCGFERVFAGMIDSDDPSDAGPSFVYGTWRP
jgi:aminoglycoside 6'-N-acetyltransferase